MILRLLRDQLLYPTNQKSNTTHVFLSAVKILYVVEEIKFQKLIKPRGSFSLSLSDMKQLKSVSFPLLTMADTINIRRMHDLNFHFPSLQEIKGGLSISEGVGTSVSIDAVTKIRNLNLKINFGLESASSQFKRADNSGAEVTLILGEEELVGNRGRIPLRPQRECTGFNYDVPYMVTEFNGEEEHTIYVHFSG